LIFDSGVGGLSVAAEIRQRLPLLAMDYVADDEFRPYGEKTAAQLKARLPGLMSILSDMLRPDVIVIACNTASTTALGGLLILTALKRNLHRYFQAAAAQILTPSCWPARIFRY